jgi:hypothetical protein
MTLPNTAPIRPSASKAAVSFRIQSAETSQSSSVKPMISALASPIPTLRAAADPRPAALT